MDEFMKAMERMNRDLRDPSKVPLPNGKIGTLEATLMQKGGMGAIFNDGLTADDVMENGILIKYILHVDPRKEYREQLKRIENDTAFQVFSSGDLYAAQRVLDFGWKRMEYALLSTGIPRTRGAQPENLLDELILAIKQKYENTHIWIIGDYQHPQGELNVPANASVITLGRNLIRHAEGRPAAITWDDQ